MPQPDVRGPRLRLKLLCDSAAIDSGAEANTLPVLEPQGHAHANAAKTYLTRREVLKRVGILGLGATAPRFPLARALLNADMSRALPRLPADVLNGRAASRMLVWGLQPLACDASKLDAMLKLHVGGMTYTTGGIKGWGGGDAWTGDLTATYSSKDGRSGEEWQTARGIQSGNLVALTKSRGMRLYLGTHLMNVLGEVRNSFVLPDLWDDAAWDAYLTTVDNGDGVYNFSAYAHTAGYDGIAFDPEPTSFNRGGAPTWAWNYTGNTHTEAQTKAQMIMRGRQMATSMTTAFPNAELLIYLDTSDDIQDGVDFDIVHRLKGQKSGNLINEWIDGMSSISPGFKSITLLQSIFYKPANFRMDYGVASQYNIGRIYSHVSRAWQRPDLILPKLNVVLFLWFDAGSGGGEGAVSADVAHTMATMARSWSTGDSWVLYQQNLMPAPTYALQTKLYETWANALAAGTATGTVDKNPPTIRAGTSGTGRLHRVTLSERSGSRITLTFTAAHKYGITHVDYRVFARNGVTKLASGVFQMKWNANGGLPTTNYDNAFQGISQAIVAARGTFVLVTAHTGRGQTHSTMVAV
jgi:hypothetical protein